MYCSISSSCGDTLCDGSLEGVSHITPYHKPKGYKIYYKKGNETMKHLNFKGLIFDEFVEDEEFSNIWVTMCQSCAQRFAKKLGSDRMDCGSGCCSVCGCYDMDGDLYVDFDPAEVGVLDFNLVPGKDVNLKIEGLDVSIFWHKPSLNVSWYPICQIDDGDLTVFHREGWENPEHWWDLVDDAFGFINEYLREVI